MGKKLNLMSECRFTLLALLCDSSLTWFNWAGIKMTRSRQARGWQA